MEEKKKPAFTIKLNEQDINWLYAARLKEVVEWEGVDSEEGKKAAKELKDLENNIVKEA